MRCCTKCSAVTAVLLILSANFCWTESNGIIPFEAAEAVVRELEGNLGGPLSLRDVRMDTVEVFCGHQMQLGVELDRKPYSMVISQEQDWEKLDSSKLEGNVADGSSSFGATGLESMCVLPSTTVVGPVEIDLDKPTAVNMQMPPEPLVLSGIRKLILREGAAVAVGGMKEMSLGRPVKLPKLPTAYLDSVYGTGGRVASTGTSVPNGVLHLSSKLLESATQSTSKRSVLSLKGKAGGQRIELRQEREFSNSPLQFVEISPGVVEVIARKASGSSSVDEQWAWPFPDIKGEHLQTSDSVLKGILGSHWPRLQSPIHLTTASSQALSLLRFQLELRSQSLREHSALPELENELGPVEVWQANVLIEQDSEGNKYVPLRAAQQEVHDNTVTFSYIARAMAMGNLTVSEEDRLTSLYV